MKKTLCDVIILQIALSEVSILIYGYWTIGTRSGCIMNISSQNSLSTLLFWTALMGKLNPLITSFLFGGFQKCLCHFR